MNKPICPDCGKELWHMSGNESIPAHWYCPDCMNFAWEVLPDGTIRVQMTVIGTIVADIEMEDENG